MGVLVGCPPGSHTYYRSLSPSQTSQDCWSYEAHNGSCTGWSEVGMTCSAADGTVIPKDTVQDLGLKSPIVGFTHKFNPGTQPLPCTDVYMWISRAYVSFDLSAVDPKIESLAIATLSWEPYTKHYEKGIAQPQGIPPHCFRALFAATGPWKPLQNGGTPGDLITDQLDQNWIGTPPQKITITPVVKKLLAAGGSRLHFYFTGSDEGEYGQENRSCNTTLNSLTLNLTYAAK